MPNYTDLYLGEIPQTPPEYDPLLNSGDGFGAVSDIKKSLLERALFYNKQLPSNNDPMVELQKKYQSSSPQAMDFAQGEMFDPISTNLKRYQSFNDFDKYGFVPGRDNEEIYGQTQSTGEKFENALVGAFELAKYQFSDQLKGWGRLFDAVGSWDFSQLYDPEDLEESSRKFQDITNTNPIAMSAADRNSIFTWSNVFNTVQQSGFTLGALAEIAAEELLTFGLVSGFQGTKVAGLLKTLSYWGRDAQKLSDIVHDGSSLRKVYNAGKFTPFSNSITEITQGIARSASPTDLFKRGFGGVYRDLRELNAAFTEAKAEAAGTFTDMKDRFIQEAIDNGEPLTPEKISEIEKYAKEAADTNFKLNSAIIGISNRIQFDNVFKGFRGASKYLDENSAIGFTGKKWYKKGLNWNTLKYGVTKSPVQYFKNNITEALQENFQEASNNAVQKYYEARYKNQGYDILGSALTGIGTQFSKEGIKTFLSGFLTGAITSPVSKGIPKTYQYIDRKFSPESQKRYEVKKQQLQNTVSRLNGLFSGEHGPNSAIQTAIANVMGQSVENNDAKTFQDMKDLAIVELARTAIETGQTDAIFDRLDSYVKNLTKEEFEAAHGTEDLKFSESGKKSAIEYVDSLRKKVAEIEKDNEEIEFRFGKNPFSPGTTQFAAYNNAKWQILTLKNAHRRATDRISTLLSEVTTSLKNVQSSDLVLLFDKESRDSELKILNESLKLNPKDRNTKVKIRAIEALNSSQEFNPVAYRNYIAAIASDYNLEKPLAENESVALDKLRDLHELHKDNVNYIKNLDWIVNPNNIRNFINIHTEEIEQLINEPAPEEKPEVTNQPPTAETTNTTQVDNIAEAFRADARREYYHGQYVDKDGKLKVSSILQEVLNYPPPTLAQYLSENEIDIESMSLEDKQLLEQALYKVAQEENEKGWNIRNNFNTIRETAWKRSIVNEKLPIADRKPILTQAERDYLEKHEEYRTLILGPEGNYQTIIMLIERYGSLSDKKWAGLSEEDVIKEDQGEDTEEEPDLTFSVEYDAEKEPAPQSTGGVKTSYREVPLQVPDSQYEIPINDALDFARGSMMRLIKSGRLSEYGLSICIRNVQPSDFQHSVPSKFMKTWEANPYNTYNYAKSNSTWPTTTASIVFVDVEGNEVKINPDHFSDEAIPLIDPAGLFVNVSLSKDAIQLEPNQVIDVAESQITVLPGAVSEFKKQQNGFYNPTEIRTLEEYLSGTDYDIRSSKVSRAPLRYIVTNYDGTRNGGFYFRLDDGYQVKLLPQKLAELTDGTNKTNILDLINRPLDNALDASKLMNFLNSVLQTRDSLKKLNFYRASVSSSNGKYLVVVDELIPTEYDDKGFGTEFKSTGKSQDEIKSELSNIRMNVRIAKDKDSYFIPYDSTVNFPYLANDKVEFNKITYGEFLIKNAITKAKRYINPITNKPVIVSVNNGVAINLIKPQPEPQQQDNPTVLSENKEYVNETKEALGATDKNEVTKLEDKSLDELTNDLSELNECIDE